MTHIADLTPVGHVTVYAVDDGPTPVATITDFLGHDPLDDVLALHGWRRISAWHRSDGTPPGHRQPSFRLAARSSRRHACWRRSRPVATPTTRKVELFDALLDLNAN